MTMTTAMVERCAPAVHIPGHVIFKIRNAAGGSVRPLAAVAVRRLSCCSCDVWCICLSAVVSVRRASCCTHDVWGFAHPLL